ncbi:MAG: efflux RND transporter permease subunit [Gammaproteobacteria bacterium]
MIAWFARNDVAANLLMITIVILGLMSISRLGITTYPEVSPDQVLINVTLRGATPEDAELGVAVRIEEAVQDIEGIDTIVSQSVEGGTSVTVSAVQGYDPRELLADVKARVDGINTFPVDAEKPVVSLRQRKIDVLKVAVYGDQSDQELRRYAELIRDDLLRLEAISLVELTSVQNYEINIEVSQDRLRDTDLTLGQIAQAIRDSSLDASAGNVRTEGGNVLIRSKGQAYRQADFDNIIVKTNDDGSILRVGDVADVRDGFEEDALKNSFNGKNAVMMNVYRTGTQSALEISKATRDFIEDKQDSLPNGLFVTHWDDDTVYLKGRLTTLLTGAAQGGLLVILLLALFLRPAIAFWVFLGIPVSFLGGLLTLWMFGFTINIMSLFGFIVVLGIVVDDAIVTGENVYSHFQMGKEGLQASVDGTREVAIPVTYGILTTVAAFAPLLVLDGAFRRFFMPIGVVVIPVLLFSLVESKFVLPAHLKHIRMNRGDDLSKLAKLQRSFSLGFERWVLKYYQPTLRSALKNRHAVLMGFIGIFFVAVSAISSGWIKFTFFPRVESETVRMTLQMPVGTPFEVTDMHMQRAIDVALELQQEYRNGEGDDAGPLIEKVYATVGAAGRGGTGPHMGRVLMETVPADIRVSKETPRDISNEWRKRVGLVPGADSVSFRAERFRAGDPINVQLSGNSLEDLQRVATKVKERLATYPTVFDITDNLSDGKEELRVNLTRQGQVLGLTRAEILAQLSRGFRGFEAQRIQRGRDDVRVLVRLPKSERSSIATLDEFLVTAPNGRQVPLSHVATIEAGRGPSQIIRVDRYRTLSVTADVDKEQTNMTVLTADLKSYLDELMVSAPGVTYTTEGEDREQRLLFQSLKLAVTVVLFVIYCLLALPLRSYSKPILVMSVIPFGLIGALIGHFVMRIDMSILSVFGLLALTGVVINDSLVLVDYISRQRSKGVELGTAALTAGASRFRPVMLTSITTFFGLVPIMFSTSTQAKFLVPMAVSLGFGILFATMITLILIPVNVLIAGDLRTLYRRIRGRKTGEKPEWIKI